MCSHVLEVICQSGTYPLTAATGNTRGRHTIATHTLASCLYRLVCLQLKKVANSRPLIPKREILVVTGTRCKSLGDASSLHAPMSWRTSVSRVRIPQQRLPETREGNMLLQPKHLLLARSTNSATAQQYVQRGMLLSAAEQQ